MLDIHPVLLLITLGLTSGENKMVPGTITPHAKMVKWCMRQEAVTAFSVGISSRSKALKLNLQPTVTPTIDQCGAKYKRISGDIAGSGKIDGKGGGQTVEECGQCADMCSELKTCASFECSPTEVCRNQF